MRILVPGGAGYIGSFTVQALQAAGHEAVVYDNLSYGHPQAIDGVELVRGDVGDAAALDACLGTGEFDAIMDFAAFIEAGESMRDAARFFANNTGNAITLLNAAARHDIKSFIFSSTAGLYGNPVRLPIKESDPTVPTNVYAASKLLVEQMLPWYEMVYGVRSVALRYFNAAGAALDGSMGQDHEPATHIITVAIQAALGQHPVFPLFGDDYPTHDGTCIRDYIHVLDLASGHVAAAEHLAAGGHSEVFNVGAGHGFTNWEVIRTVQRLSGVEFRIEVRPRRSGDPIALIADSTKLREQLGWTPRYSDLDTIVGTAWEWHRSHPAGYCAG
jgi:UDP-glucose 4-epimerase